MYQKLTNANVLVTGGAGFIGSNLCVSFLESGNKVVCLDNFSTGNINNISALLKNKNFTLIEGDIRDISTCKSALKKIDYVFHQAALGSVPRSINDPLTTNEVNITGFLNMLQAAKDEKIKRFIYAASSSTYGDSTILPKKEDIIGKPLSPYAVTKYVNEIYAHVYGLTYNIDCIGLRYFNVFGPNQSPDGAYAAVIPKFINLLLNGEAPVINGNGKNSRDFTFIENIIQMNHLAATTTNQNAIGQVFNTAYGAQTSLIELVDIIAESLSKYFPEVSLIQPIFGPIREGDIPHSKACIQKAKEMLNYSPQVDLSEGMNLTIQSFLKKMKIF